MYGNSIVTSLQVLEHIKEAVRIKLAGLRFLKQLKMKDYVEDGNYIMFVNS